MAKQHQQDREFSGAGHLEKTLCGRDMPRGGSTWGFESCERCAAVSRARADRARAESNVKMAKSAKQLDAEIKEVLTAPGVPTASTPKRLTKTQIQKLRVELRKAIKSAKTEAEDQHRYMKHDDYERAAEDAIRAAGIRGQAAAQPGDDGVEIWESVPGQGAVGDQIAEHHDSLGFDAAYVEARFPKGFRPKGFR